MLNRGEIRTRDLGVTSPHALPSELHGQPDFKTVNYDIYYDKRIHSVNKYTISHIIDRTKYCSVLNRYKLVMFTRFNT